MRKIRVLFVPTEGTPTVDKIEDKLENYQEYVNGYIETDRIAPGLIAVVNEEGVWLDLPLNSNIRKRTYFGNVIFCRIAGDEFDSLSLGDLIYLHDNHLRVPAEVRDAQD